MKDRYRRFPMVTDIAGMKSAIGEMHGKGFPKQPPLNKNYTPTGSDPELNEAWFIQTIKDKIANHPYNSFEYPFFGEKILDDPLVGFIWGDDPLLAEYKQILGPHHLTPQEVMKWQADQNGVPSPKAKDLSVVSFVMPFTPSIKADNARETQWAAERWAQTRLIGEIFSQIFVREIVTELMRKGVLAISPDVTPMFNKKRYPNVGWASPWSHRHMAYAAGLGTFGMHDFLVTEKGCAHRVGSFVVNLKLEPNRQRPGDIHANCLHYQGFKCLKCKSRCPVDAISKENAHDKEKCSERVAASLKYCIKNYHIFIYGCGLCATGTPCESEIPVALQKRDIPSVVSLKSSMMSAKSSTDD
ncbi:MAG: epoxyqueuosine reductase [Proteobacteria bacterium]|nr:epoxyqueuosine reductase [Pseudomonadota bacterium]MBU4470783.1 epoxyqueuosine reductase [Pseudomonadota bacterium]MCG2751489.1 epoxyqueuosine reductase [Desulfobacteraceae bacterium]